MQTQKKRASLAHHSGLSAFAPVPLLACHPLFISFRPRRPIARAAIVTVDTSARQSLMTVAFNIKQAARFPACQVPATCRSALVSLNLCASSLGPGC